MASKYDTLVKDTAIFAIGKFGSKIILFILVPLYTNFLTAEEYGVAELVLTLSQIIVPIISLMIFDGIMRFGLAKGSKKEDVLLIGVIITFADAIICLFIVYLAGFYAPIANWRWYLYWNILLYIAYNVELNYMKANDHNLMFSIVSILQTLVIGVSSILLLAVLHLGIQGYLLASNISFLIAFIFCFFTEHIWSSLKRAKFDKSLLIQMVKYSAPLAINNISWGIVQSSDKFMLEYMIGQNALGLYTLASKIPSLINVFISIFQQSWGISSIREVESTNDKSFYKNVLTVYYISIFFVCIALNSIIKPFMKIYVANDFGESWRFVPLLLVSAAFSAISVYYGGLYGAIKKSLNSMNTMIVAACVNIIFNYVLIHYFGVLGAAASTLISYVVLTVLRIIDMNRYLKIEISWSRFVINSMIVIAQSIFVTMDFHIVILSSFTGLLFIAINRRELSTVLTKGLSRMKKKGIK